MHLLLETVKCLPFIVTNSAVTETKLSEGEKKEKGRERTRERERERETF